MHPVVSVIVPVYNAAAFLRQTLNCICGQTLKEIEIILVDDGSTDETPAILQEYAARDSRITLLQQEHEYAGAARNKGMAIARGKYYSFLDADDLFEPTMLEKMVERAEEVGADVVICKADSFNTETGKHQPMRHQLKGYYPEGLNKKKFNVAEEMPQLLCAFQPWAWDKLFLADHVRKLNLSFGTTHRVNDILFVYPATAAAKVASIIDDEVLVHYRISTTQLSSEGAIMKDVMCMVDNARATHDKMKKVGIAGDIMISFCCRIAGSLAWTVTNTFGEARETLADAIKTFERDYQCLPEITKALKMSKFCEMLKPMNNNLHLYQAITTPGRYTLKFSEDSMAYTMKSVISVVIPIYNAARYLREGLNSILRQTYKDLEIICVNDGSTDDSLKIIHEYAAKDSRFVVLDGPNGGYGKAMNRGMAVATGKYFAIFEPDDVLPPKAYETLVTIAETHNLDIAKGCVSRFVDKNGKRSYYETPHFKTADTGRVICPLQELGIFTVNMNTWTCLYSMDFIRQHDIKHHESPGASYQDNGLFFLSFTFAKRLMCINEVVYHCRRDNVNSSVYSMAKKPYAMLQEYRFIKNKLELHPGIWEIVKPVYLKKMLANQLYVYNRIYESDKLSLLETIREDLIALEDVEPTYLSDSEKYALKLILRSPLLYLFAETYGLMQSPKPAPKQPAPATKPAPETKSAPATKPAASSSPQKKQQTKSSRFVKISPHKKELRVLGIPVWSKNTKTGRCIYRLFGVRVRHKKIK